MFYFCCGWWHLHLDEHFGRDIKHDYVYEELAPTTCCKTNKKAHSHSLNGHFRNLNWRYLQYHIQGLCKGISYPNKIWPYIMVQYLHFRILKFPLTVPRFQKRQHQKSFAKFPKYVDYSNES